MVDEKTFENRECVDCGSNTFKILDARWKYKCNFCGLRYMIVPMTEIREWYLEN